MIHEEVKADAEAGAQAYGQATEVTIRPAQLSDAPRFRELWRELLMESELRGSEIAASEGNLDFYVGLFAAYCDGSLPGAPMILDTGEVWGATLWGAMPASLLFSFPRPAYAHGTFVERTLRGRGYSKKLRAASTEALRGMGFTHIIGSYIDGDVVGKASALAFGFKPTSHSVVLEL